MLPEEFTDRMQRMLGEEYKPFLESFGQERYRALRLNPLKRGADGRSGAEALCPGGADGAESKVHAAGPERSFARLAKVPWAEDGYYYEEKDQPGRHPYHDAGLYYIQEPSAMAPAELLGLRPGQRVLDLCAAPGGKSTQIAAKLQGRGWLVCNEINPARAKILSENIERMGIANACVINEPPQRLAGFFPEYFDRILVDAPCSGEGMFRKNDAACEEWSLENIALCAGRQDEILDCAARMLRPGGRLVYSTCTFAPEENEGSIARFLERHGDFHVLPIEKGRFGTGDCSGRAKYSGEGLSKAPDGSGLEGTLRLWPHRIKGEGHFAALLSKGGEAQEVFWGNSTAGMGRSGEGRTENTAGGGAKGRRKNGTKNLQGGEQDMLGEAVRFCRENLRIPVSDERLLAAGLAGAVRLEAGAGWLAFGDNLYLVPSGMPSLRGLKVLRPGLHVGEIKKNRFEPSHALALALSPENALHIWNLPSGSREALAYLSGAAFPAAGEKGWYLICVDGFSLGWGKLAGGIMKNHYPKGLRRCTF